MHRDQGCEAAKFHHKIPIRHGIHRVLSDHRLFMRIHETELARDKFPVQRQGAAGNCPAA